MMSHLQQVGPLTLALFALWVMLSGKLDALHLLMGAASVITITLGTQRLFLLPPAIGPAALHPVQALPWRRLVLYVPWLFWQVVVSSIQVAYAVLHPAMPISPRLLRFRMELPHNLARLTLATSITLTPGTITLDVDGDEFLVHTLTDVSATGLNPAAGRAAMPQRVAALYSQPQQSHPTGASG
jgi:multicomponent Na+:H+ antiporter subunit E